MELYCITEDYKSDDPMVEGVYEMIAKKTGSLCI